MDSMISLLEPAIRYRFKAKPVLSVKGQIRMAHGRFACANLDLRDMEPLDLANADYRFAARGGFCTRA